MKDRNGRISPGRTADAWIELDRILSKNPYMRFSLDTHRNWDDARRRVWQAVVFMEKGRLLARVYAETRDEAVAGVVREMMDYESEKGRGTS